VTPLSSDYIPDFYIPTEIFIQEQILNTVGPIVKKFGSRAVIISTSADYNNFENTIQQISTNLAKSDVSCIIFDEIPDDPNTEDIDSAVFFIKKTGCDVVIGFGGIESMNAAKAISLLINNFLFCEELFENPKIQTATNLVIIPAYPLFGFEIIPMLYLTEIHEMKKLIYKNRLIFPKAAIVDPHIATIIRDDLTANTAISTLALATESVISKKNNGLINTLALRAIDLVFKNLPIAYRDQNNTAPRLHIAEASIMAGMAFSISELSVSLAVAIALATKTSIPIERGMGMILPHIMEYNLTTSPGKYVQMSKVMDEDVKDITVIEAAIKAVEGVRKIEIEVEIPQRLSQFDIPKNELSKIADLTMQYPFIENAPRPLTKNEIETILIAAY
jgi:alcohol dehydrogenase class IV